MQVRKEGVRKQSVRCGKERREGHRPHYPTKHKGEERAALPVWRPRCARAVSAEKRAELCRQRSPDACVQDRWSRSPPQPRSVGGGSTAGTRPLQRRQTTGRETTAYDGHTINRFPPVSRSPSSRTASDSQFVFRGANCLSLPSRRAHRHPKALPVRPAPVRFPPDLFRSLSGRQRCSGFSLPARAGSTVA